VETQLAVEIVECCVSENKTIFANMSEDFKHRGRLAF